MSELRAAPRRSADPVGDDVLVDLHRQLVLARTIEEKMLNLLRRGQLS